MAWPDSSPSPVHPLPPAEVQSIDNAGASRYGPSAPAGGTTSARHRSCSRSVPPTRPTPEPGSPWSTTHQGFGHRLGDAVELLDLDGSVADRASTDAEAGEDVDQCGDTELELVKDPARVGHRGVLAARAGVGRAGARRAEGRAGVGVGVCLQSTTFCRSSGGEMSSVVLVECHSIVRVNLGASTGRPLIGCHGVFATVRSAGRIVGSVSNSGRVRITPVSTEAGLRGVLRRLLIPRIDQDLRIAWNRCSAPSKGEVSR